MSDLMTNITYVYMQIGVTGLIIIMLCIVAIWWMTTGRKERKERNKRDSDASVRYAEEYARMSIVMDNSTAAINNNTEVIKANTLQRQLDQHCLENLTERMQRHGEQHDEMLKNQAVALALRQRKE